MVAREYSRVVGSAVVAMVCTFPVGAGADKQGGAPSDLQSAAHSEKSGAITGTTRKRERWPRVRVPEPVARHATLEALDKAWAWLGTPACASVVADFTDRDGYPLADRLTALGMDVQTYLTVVVFIDDTRSSACVTGALAHAVPGSRVVRLCSDELKRTYVSRPTYAAAIFIHEMLHTLGLGEDPPSSAEITRQVLARCGQA